MRNLNSVAIAALVFLGFIVALQASAQTLYKYVDKDGKITYSDKPPKDGEKATKVTIDTNANVTRLNTKDASGKEQKFADIKARGDARAALRDKLQGEIKTAETNLEKAKKALEDGRVPLEGETRIVVGKTSNSVQRTPEYFARIEALEEAVKKAEARVKEAEVKFQRGAPD
jgi:Domain of unknown function (DUF4124)